MKWYLDFIKDEGMVKGWLLVARTLPSYSGAWKGAECLEVDEGMAITPCIDIQVTGGLYACFLATSKVRAASQSASYSTFKGPWIPFFVCLLFREVGVGSHSIVSLTLQTQTSRGWLVMLRTEKMGPWGNCRALCKEQGWGERRQDQSQPGHQPA